MQYHLRRDDKEIIDKNEILRILKSGKYITIGLCLDEEPYVVTLSYGYEEKSNTIYYHCASEGQKIEYIKRNPYVCATIIEDKGYVEGDCSHRFSSLIIRGKMKIVNDKNEKVHGLDILLHHLETNPDKIRESFINDAKAIEKVCILCLEISSITGKQNL